MEVAALAQMFLTLKRAEAGQNASMQAMKTSLQQDTAVLQIVAAATAPTAQAALPAPSDSGKGLVVDILA
ncbi:MAG TPA: hypothetical protein VL974_01780 [Magnetospirillum sp.]|nr:hypothetical protein [Magnetospirillum sp.]